MPDNVKRPVEEEACTSLPIQANLLVGEDGYLYADGIRIGRLVGGRNDPCLQFVDRLRSRSRRRGTRFVNVPIRLSRMGLTQNVICAIFKLSK